MDTKTNIKIMTAKQARETISCSDKTLEFMERLGGKIKEEIDQRTSNGYLTGSVVISMKDTSVNHVAAVEEIVKELEKLGYTAGWNWRNNIITGMTTAIHLFFDWRE